MKVAVVKDLSPDVFTAAGVVAALLAAISIWQGWWPLALVFLALRLGGANLDGAVARARMVSRPWGFVLNEIGDRGSDLLMFVGLIALAWRTDGFGSVAVWSMTVAALAAILPTFVSLSGAGAGAARRNGGPFGKTERCLVAVFAAALPGWLVAVSVVFVVGSLLTAAVRLRWAHRELTGMNTETAS